MGENSRTIGFLGENIVIANIFKMIGWNGLENLEFTCKNYNKHKKQTHDIDFFTTYKCPLEKDTQQIIFVSVKYTDPKSEKTTFLDYSKKLFYSSECFKTDIKYAQNIKHIDCFKKRFSHLLVWLNHSEPDNFSLTYKIGNVCQEIDYDIENIYLLDNHRLTFLYNVIQFSKNNFQNSSIDFVYQRTGINETIEGGRKLCGDILPIEFINSPIIPIRITQSDNKKILLLALNEKLEEDTLLRLMGFAQNLTEGWCNKIILCFPEYQSKHHSSLVNSVMLKFMENKFADMVEIKSLKDSFKNLEQNYNAAYLDSNKETDVEFNVETMLPFGDQLRQLINQSYIYKQDLQLLLTRRGVFTSKSVTKEILTPFFAKTLISPNEFEFLRQKQSTKEHSEKIVSQTIKTKESADIKQVLPSINLPLQSFVEKANINCELINTSDFIFNPNGDISYNYEIKRKNVTKDWATLKSLHSGGIIIKKAENSSNDYRIDIVSTSSDTKQVNKEIVNYVLTYLKESDLLTKNAEPEKMIASHLTNIQRTNFLFSLIDFEKTDTQHLKFYSITDVEIKPDGTKKLPEDIESLKDRVEHHILEGRNLQEIKYIADKEFRNYFIFINLTVEYNFEFDDIKGRTQIQFGYPDFTDKPNDQSEFEFKIQSISTFGEINLSKQENHEVNEFLKAEFKKLITLKYDKTERKFKQGKLF